MVDALHLSWFRDIRLVVTVDVLGVIFPLDLVPRSRSLSIKVRVLFNHHFKQSLNLLLLDNFGIQKGTVLLVVVQGSTDGFWAQLLFEGTHVSVLPVEIVATLSVNLGLLGEEKAIEMDLMH